MYKKCIEKEPMKPVFGRNNPARTWVNGRYEWSGRFRCKCALNLNEEQQKTKQ